MLPRHPLLTLLLSFLALSASAQTLAPDSPIVPGHVNLLYLNHLVKTGVDSVRKLHGLKPLANDSTLFAAAQDHTDYLNRTNKLGHFQEDVPGMHAPTDRVNHYGGSDFSVGENVLMNYAHTPVTSKHDPKAPPHTNETYGQLAADMVSQWVHSPPHYKNMITPEYEFTGVATSYNPAGNSFRAVQVFGLLPYYQAPVTDTITFPYAFSAPPVVSSFDQVSHTPHSEVHAWGLRAPEDSATTCADCWSEEFSPGTTKIEVKNGNVIFTTKQTAIMERLLNNKKDGMALEVVSYKPYDCGNPQYYEKPSRRNRQCLFSGRVLKPLYRKRLKRGFRKKEKHNFVERLKESHAGMQTANNFRGKMRAIHDAFVYPFESEIYSISLGKLPKDLSGYYEVNIVLIQKGQVCRVLHFTDYCGQDWDVQSPVADVAQFHTDTFRMESKLRAYDFRIPFGQNKYEYMYSDIRPFLDSLGASAFTVLGAQIDAFASVEGSEEINDRLQQQRAASIISAMQGVQKDTIAVKITTTENWKLFDEQVKTVPAFAVFKGKSHEQVKQMLADTVLAHKLEPWLAKERAAYIHLQVRIDYKPDTSCGWLVPRLRLYTDSAQHAVREHLRPVFLDSLADLQAWYYRGLAKQEADTNCLYSIEYPAKPPFDTLAYNWAWMKHQFLAAPDTQRTDLIFYNECTNIMNTAEKSQPYWPAVYAMAKYEVKYWTPAGSFSNDPDRIYKWIEWMENAVPDSMVERLSLLRLSWHYKAVDYYEAKGKSQEAKVIRSLGVIAEYWQDPVRANDSIALVLSNFILHHGYPGWAYMVLAPAALKENPRHDVLMQFLKLSYQHKDESPGFAEYAALLTRARSYLSHEEWCSLFVGPCNISFQLWDSEAMRNLYCEECGEWKNYGKDPSKWRTK